MDKKVNNSGIYIEGDVYGNINHNNKDKNDGSIWTIITKWASILSIIGFFLGIYFYYYPFNESDTKENEEKNKIKVEKETVVKNEKEKYIPRYIPVKTQRIITDDLSKSDKINYPQIIDLDDITLMKKINNLIINEIKDDMDSFNSSITYKIYLNDFNHLGIYFDIFTYSAGAARCVQSFKSLLLDIKTGNRIKFFDLINNQEDIKKINNLILKDEQVDKDFFKGIDENVNFYFDKEKMYFLFDRNEVAAGIYGSIIVDIPLNKITSWFSKSIIHLQVQHSTGI